MPTASVQFGEKISRRLKEEQVIWLTTVRADGSPQPTPVWFLWDGETFLIYSMPTAHKLRNVAANPRVALNLNSDAYGGEVVIVFGRALVDRNCPKAHQNPDYLEKYRQGIADIDMTPESMGQEYSVAIRIVPDGMRSF